MPLDAGFLEMLTHSVVWEPFTGESAFGAKQYGPPQTIQCFVTAQVTAFGNIDSENRIQPQEVEGVSIITDAIGVGLKDRFTFDGHVYYTTGVETVKDEDGVDLMHTVSATEAEKG